MNRRVFLALTLVAALLASVVGYLVWQRARTERYRTALVQYDAALASALATLEPSRLGPLAGPRETQRVTSYITLLWGESKRMDSELLSMDVVSIETSGASATVKTRERWRYREVDRVTGTASAPEREIEQSVTYTVVERDGRLVVDLSLVDESGEGISP